MSASGRLFCASPFLRRANLIMKVSRFSCGPLECIPLVCFRHWPKEADLCDSRVFRFGLFAAAEGHRCVSPPIVVSGSIVGFPGLPFLFGGFRTLPPVTDHSPRVLFALAAFASQIIPVGKELPAHPGDSLARAPKGREFLGGRGFVFHIFRFSFGLPARTTLERRANPSTLTNPHVFHPSTNRNRGFRTPTRPTVT